MRLKCVVASCGAHVSFVLGVFRSPFWRGSVSVISASVSFACLLRHLAKKCTFLDFCLFVQCFWWGAGGPGGSVDLEYIVKYVKETSTSETNFYLSHFHYNDKKKISQSCHLQWKCQNWNPNYKQIKPSTSLQRLVQRLNSKCQVALLKYRATSSSSFNSNPSPPKKKVANCLDPWFKQLQYGHVTLLYIDSIQLCRTGAGPGPKLSLHGCVLKLQTYCFTVDQGVMENNVFCVDVTRSRFLFKLPSLLSGTLHS